MIDSHLSSLIAMAIAVMFGVSAFVHLLGPDFIRDAYRRWNFPPMFHRVTGILELLAAIFLALPATRIWGVALAALVTFVAVVTLLNNRQYAWTLPGFLVLAALVPASVSGLI
ncbi:MAG TPA: DoxX family protein [Rhizomicrobium sp.]|jgi:uncharacterized membrane protein YphA (DoxX/SURF4 family)